MYMSYSIMNNKFLCIINVSGDECPSRLREKLQTSKKLLLSCNHFVCFKCFYRMKRTCVEDGLDLCCPLCRRAL